MEIIDYTKGCKCAYCKNNVEDPNFAEERRLYKITGTSLMGSRASFIEYKLRIPVCKECNRINSREGMFIALTGTVIWIALLVAAFIIAYRSGNGFIGGLFYCIPATMIAGIIIKIMQAIEKIIKKKAPRTERLFYEPLFIFRRYGFTEKRPSPQETHYSTDWPDVKDKFYADLSTWISSNVSNSEVMQTEPNNENN